MDADYVKGFMANAAELGVDPQALVKSAKELTSDSERANTIAGRIGAVYGALTAAGVGLPLAVTGALVRSPKLIAAGLGTTGAGGLAGRGIGRAFVPNEYVTDQPEALLGKESHFGRDNEKERKMNKESKMNEDYVAGFMAKAAELGVDPEVLLGKEAFLGSAIRGIKEMGMTTEDIAKGRQGKVDAYGKKGFWGRLGQGLWDPNQAERSRDAYGTLKPGLGKELSDADDIRGAHQRALYAKAWAGLPST